MKESGIGSQKIIRRKRGGELEYLPDELTIEEPLEIRVERKPIAKMKNSQPGSYFRRVSCALAIRSRAFQ